MSGDVATEVTALLAEPLAPLGLVCLETTVATAGTRRVLRVLVDRDVADLAGDPSSSVDPVSLDEVSDATRVVGDALDASPVMGERPYTLEVSSAGVGRPLSGYAALRRNVGRLVTLAVTDGDDPTDLTGRVTLVTADEVVVEVPAGRRTPARTHTVPLDRVRSGRVQVEFNRSDSGAGEEG